MLILSIDDRREIVVPGNIDETIHWAVNHWIQLAKNSIKTHNRFAVALSGGSTPNLIYQMLAKEPYSKQVDWSKVYLFWSDERAVIPTSDESNFHSAMIHGLQKLPIPPSQIFRMEAEKEIHSSASHYETLIKKTLGSSLFDLVMLGLGADGHTASLFPNTSALHSKNLAAPNYVEEKKSWRITLTIPCINQSKQTVFYVFGQAKQKILADVLRPSDVFSYPANQIGTPQRKALYIADQEAASHLIVTP